MSSERQKIESKIGPEELLSRKEWEDLYLKPNTADNNAENDLNDESLGVGIAYIVESAGMILEQIQNRVSSIKSRVKNCLKSFVRRP